MDERQRLREGLPDYVAGRADPADAARIGALLADDPELASDAAWMEEIRTALRSEAASFDGSAGLADLRRRIARPPLWRRALALLELPLLAPAAIAVLACVCVLQGWLLWRPAPPQQLAWRDVAPALAAPAAKLQVRFDPQASLAQVEDALALARARIVAGPLADHSYLLDAAAPAPALASLRASPAVREVRPLTAPAP